MSILPAILDAYEELFKNDVLYESINLNALNAAKYLKDFYAICNV